MSSSNSSLWGSIRFTFISMGMGKRLSSDEVLNYINFTLKNAFDTYLVYMRMNTLWKSRSAFFFYLLISPMSLLLEFDDNRSVISARSSDYANCYTTSRNRFTLHWRLRMVLKESFLIAACFLLSMAQISNNFNSLLASFDLLKDTEFVYRSLNSFLNLDINSVLSNLGNICFFNSKVGFFFNSCLWLAYIIAGLFLARFTAWTISRPNILFIC